MTTRNRSTGLTHGACSLITALAGTAALVVVDAWINLLLSIQ
jgi:hypothetical protein